MSAGGDPLAGAGWLAAIAAGVAAVRWRALARADRLALRLAQSRETAFVEGARRLSDASRISIASVRTEMQAAVRAIVPALDVVAFFEEHDGALRCVAADGSRMAYYTAAVFALDDERTLLGRALRSERRASSREFPAAERLHPGDRYAAAMPVVLDVGRRAVVYVAGAQPPGDDPADLLVRLVDGATPAYRIALERADDRARAEFDGLTGLLTARAFRTQLGRLLDAAASDPLARIALLFIDTDRFKAWNDTYGHASGDALLREIASLLRSAAEPGDLVARNGGDEFCLVFAATEKSRAIERAERLRAAVASAHFEGLHGPASVTVPISASIGVACFPTDARSSSALLEMSDAAMYHSKQTGRDGVSFYSLDGAPVRAR